MLALEYRATAVYNLCVQTLYKLLDLQGKVKHS